MAKNRKELEAEAKELGLDTSSFESNKEFQEAIDAKNAENGNGESTPPAAPVEGEAPASATEPGKPQEASHVNDKPQKNSPALGSTPDGEAVDPETGMVDTPTNKARAEKVEAVLGETEDAEFDTSEPVEFNVEGVKYAGTHFVFPANVVEDRKRILRDAYGKDIIIEK